MLVLQNLPAGHHYLSLEAGPNQLTGGLDLYAEIADPPGRGSPGTLLGYRATL